MTSQKTPEEKPDRISEGGGGDLHLGQIVGYKSPSPQPILLLLMPVFTFIVLKPNCANDNIHSHKDIKENPVQDIRLIFN